MSKRPTTTWACRNDRVGIPGADIDAVPDAAVEGEIALLVLAGIRWEHDALKWNGYSISYKRVTNGRAPATSARVELVRCRDNQWLAVSLVQGASEAELRNATIDWGIRAALALAMLSLERGEDVVYRDNQYV